MMIALIFTVALGYGVQANQPPVIEDLPLMDPMSHQEMEQLVNDFDKEKQ
jgi:hypothetical protein